MREQDSNEGYLTLEPTLVATTLYGHNLNGLQVADTALHVLPAVEEVRPPR